MQALPTISPTLESTYKNAPQPAASREDLTEIFLKNCCSGCFKQEVFDRFKLCGKCKKIRYCSSACQKKDWARHFPLCPDKVDKEMENVAIQEGRQQLFEKMKKNETPSISQFKVNPAKLAKVKKELSSRGPNYRTFLLEECLSALAKNHAASHEENSELLCLTLQDDLIQQYPLQNQSELDREGNPKPHFGIQEELYRFASHWENFKSRMLNNATLKDKEETLPLLIESFQILESQAVKGTIFLNKGYPPEIEEALQLLRIRIFEIIGCPKEGKQANEYVMAWVFNKVSTLSCIEETTYQTFISAIETHNGLLMLTCLNWALILEDALKNRHFLEIVILHKNFKVSDLVQIIKLMKKKIGNQLAPQLQSISFLLAEQRLGLSNLMDGKLAEEDAKIIMQILENSDSPILYQPTQFLMYDTQLLFKIAEYFCQKIQAR